MLPENFSFMGSTDVERVAAVERFGDGPAQRVSRARRRAALRLWIVGGTIPIRDDGARAREPALAAARPDGRVAAHYDKIHLFDVDIPGRAAERYIESRLRARGRRAS